MNSPTGTALRACREGYPTMQSRILRLFALNLLAVPMVANATLFSLAGTFDDGGSLSGTIDVAGNCVIDQNVASLTTTSGSLLGGTSYSGHELGGMCDGSGNTGLYYPAGDYGLSLYFSPALKSSSGIVLITNKSFEWLTTSGATRYLTSGTASSVPEPGTLALLGLGLAGLGLSRRRKLN